MKNKLKKVAAGLLAMALVVGVAPAPRGSVRSPENTEG